MDTYEHTQTGTLMRIILGCGTVVSGAIAVFAAFKEPSSAVIAAAVACVLLVCGLLFHSLTVKVSDDCITLSFGIGLIGKRFAIADIQSATIVRNRWYYGWGVRLTPHGWLYNVSGFEAVEIQLKNGRKYSIGTDEPAELLQVIESAIADAS